MMLTLFLKAKLSKNDLLKNDEGMIVIPSFFKLTGEVYEDFNFRCVNSWRRS